MIRQVELDALHDSDRLVPHMAAALGVGERPGLSLFDALACSLDGPQTVLLMDNCEHIIDACAELAATLLHRCPQLRILATSREALRVPGESVFRVGGLSLPPDNVPATCTSVLSSEAVQLFVERARFSAPGFRLTSETAEAVAEICRRLDGLPLALELAARRAGSLPVSQIVAGLDDRLTLLNDGSRTGPSRHRGLGAAFEWSYTLLEPAEQAVFRRLSVFVDDFSIEGAQAVCAAGDISANEVLRLLCALEVKSLLVHSRESREAARFRLLSPLRAYGLELLRSTGELAATRQRALTWLADLVRPLSSTDPGDELLLQRMEQEQENIAAAVKWTRHEHSDRHLLFAMALTGLRHHQEQVTESRRILGSALNAVGDSDLLGCAFALAARLACMQSDDAEGLRLAQQSVALARGQAGPDQPRRSVDALDALAVAFLTRGDFTGAQRVYQECLEIVAGSGRPLVTAIYRHRLAWALFHTSDLEEARELMEECLPTLHAEAPQRHQCAALHTAGAIYLALGDVDAADAAFVGSLHKAPPHSVHALYPVEGLAIVAAQRGEAKRAVRLAASAEALRARTGLPAEPEWQRQVREAVARTGPHGRPTTQSPVAREDLLDGDRLVAYALRLPGHRPARRHAGGELQLSAREHQIALLVAEGLSNREIAEKLGRATATVASHLNNIRDKLGLRSRTQIALWAVAQTPDGDSVRTGPRQDGHA
ncbi:ATP-binding protein [Streptomyces sp. NPDC002004]